MNHSNSFNEANGYFYFWVLAGICGRYSGRTNLYAHEAASAVFSRYTYMYNIN